jgi:outer membrane immunogenic protein
VTIFTPAGNILNGDRSSIKTGYAFGGGVAYAIPTTSFLNFFHSSAVTLKVEYIHYDLGGSDIPVINLTGMVPIGTHIATEGNLVRAGLDYKFDFFSPSSPVVAKY